MRTVRQYRDLHAQHRIPSHLRQSCCITSHPLWLSSYCVRYHVHLHRVGRWPVLTRHWLSCTACADGVSPSASVAAVGSRLPCYWPVTGGLYRRQIVWHVPRHPGLRWTQRMGEMQQYSKKSVVILPDLHITSVVSYPTCKWRSCQYEVHARACHTSRITPHFRCICHPNQPNITPFLVSEPAGRALKRKL